MIFPPPEPSSARKTSSPTSSTKRSTPSPTRGKASTKDCGRSRTTPKLSSPRPRFVCLLFVSTKISFDIHPPEVGLKLGCSSDVSFLLRRFVDFVFAFIITFWPGVPSPEYLKETKEIVLSCLGEVWGKITWTCDEKAVFRHRLQRTSAGLSLDFLQSLSFTHERSSRRFSIFLLILLLRSWHLHLCLLRVCLSFFILRFLYPFSFLVFASGGSPGSSGQSQEFRPGGLAGETLEKVRSISLSH